jgi:MFS family permease
MSTLNLPSDAAGQKPTRVRNGVILFALSLAILAYIDRACISMAAPLISKDLHLDKVQMAWVFFVFALAYALFGVPGGWAGDRLGPKRMIILTVLWWSAFTAATGRAWDYVSLVVIRFLFGTGEAGCFPNLTKAMTIWLPQRERVRAQGVMWAFARWAGAFTPPLMAVAFKYMSWRWAFGLFGFIGVIWCAIFLVLFKDSPREHKRVNAAELALIEGSGKIASSHAEVPWGKLVSSPTVWMLWLQYFLISYPFYFYLTWLPTYLIEGRHMEFNQASRFAIFPLLFAGAGCLVSGVLFARVAQWVGSVSLARRLLGAVGFFVAGLFVLVHIQIETPLLAMLALGVATFFHDLTTPGAWGACMDVGGPYAGTLSGSMNAMGNFGSMVSPLAMGYILKYTGNNWSFCLYSVAAAYLLGTLCWPWMDPVTPLEDRKR